MKIRLIYRKPLLGALFAIVFEIGLGMSAPDSSSADPAAPVAHSDSIGAAITDTAITANVKTRLMDKNSLSQSRIRVTTTNGVVTLDGMATDEKASAEAESTAKLVDGVKSVDNELKTPTESPSSSKTGDLERIVSDSWITTKVKSKILGMSPSKGFHVNVKTIHGVVILKGNLPDQVSVATVKEMAEEVDGVKSVDVSGLTVSGN